MREPTIEEIEAWAAFLERFPDVLERPEAPAIAQLVAFKARSDARHRRSLLSVARRTLRVALSEPSDDLTAERILAARRLRLDGDRRAEWVIAATSRSTYLRRRRQFGLVPWPSEYVH